MTKKKTKTVEWKREIIELGVGQEIPENAVFICGFQKDLGQLGTYSRFFYELHTPKEKMK